MVHLNTIIKSCFVLAFMIALVNGVISIYYLKDPMATPSIISDIQGYCLGGLVFFMGQAILLHKYFYKSKRRKAKSLEESVKQGLDLDFVKTYRTRRLPRFIGGFMLPMLPIFNVINKRWRKKKKTEIAIIHEVVHSWLMMRGIIFFILFTPAMFSTIIYILLEVLFGIQLNFIAGVFIFVIPLFSITLIINEAITFYLTNHIARQLKIRQYKFTYKHIISYFIIYMIQLNLMFGLLFGLRYLIPYLIPFIKNYMIDYYIYVKMNLGG